MKTRKQLRTIGIAFVAMALFSCGQKQQAAAPGGAAAQVKEYPVIAVTAVSVMLVRPEQPTKVPSPMVFISLGSTMFVRLVQLKNRAPERYVNPWPQWMVARFVQL